MARIHDSNGEIIRELRTLTDEVIVFLSGGKDSIATLTLCLEHGMRVFPVKYGSLKMDFQEQYMRYLERRFNLPPTTYYPHPDVATYLKYGRYTVPHDNVEEIGFTDLEKAARLDSGITWIVGGEKSVDSLPRRGMLHACRGIDLKRRRAFPLADWNDRDVFAFLKRRRLPIPPDYRLFGSSYQGSTRADNMQAIRDHYPEDFAKIVEMFPLAPTAAIKQDMLDRAEQENE